MTKLFVSVSRFVPAVPHEVFELLATPTMHRAIDGSGSVRGVATGPERLFLGAEFGMQMKIAAS